MEVKIFILFSFKGHDTFLLNLNDVGTAIKVKPLSISINLKIYDLKFALSFKKKGFLETNMVKTGDLSKSSTKKA